jgi:uncharacterized protein YyaL (SSP411 family)
LTETKVSWLEWNKEAFRKAEELDKPILLDISAVWCHWCHVMDETTYSNNEVSRLIDEKFVAIRVDRDQRPDIDKRYNMGGWPTTVFLSVAGDILMGGTYIPPQQMVGLLEQVSAIYEHNRGNMKSRIRELQQDLKEPRVRQILDDSVFQSAVDGLTLEIASRFDSVHGGFDDSPKFPHSDALRLILLQNYLQGHDAALTIVKNTLSAMDQGGIYDKVEGGFFRYSTTKDWSIPHYEKMCEDNAKLLTNYLEAHQVTAEKSFMDTAMGILGYVDAKLSDQDNGGFYGSQDADEFYYTLSLDERKKRVEPRIDRTLFVNWNAMMVSSYFLASALLEEEKYQRFALKTVEFLMKKAFSPERGMSHFLIDGKSSVFGFLSDQAYMVRCLLDCYQVTFDRKFLEKAESVSEFMLNKLWDSKNGAFYDKPEDSDALGALKLLDKPLEENSVAADSFLSLYHLTGDQKYLETAKRTLEFFVDDYQRHGIMGAIYGLAVERFLQPMQIHVVGSRKEKTTDLLIKECLNAYNPLKIVELIDPEKDKDRLKALGYPASDVPIAYICAGGDCKSVEDPAKVADNIRR